MPLPLSLTAVVNLLPELLKRMVVFSVSKSVVWTKMVQGIGFTQPINFGPFLQRTDPFPIEKPL